MLGSDHTNRWLSVSAPNPQALLRLFCFPYAGGTAAIFREWHKDLPPAIEVCGIRLPGRGTRIEEPPFLDLKQLVHTMAAELRPLWEKPFALLGHSLGALIAFDLTRHLRDEYGHHAVHLFVSGSCAPNQPSEIMRPYDLSEDGFLETVRRLNGTPPKVLDHPELMKLMLPVLRADFQIAQDYKYLSGRPLNCPITAFGGSRDEEVCSDCLRAWRLETTGEFSLCMIDGDHFFIQRARSVLLQILSQQLHELTRNRV